MDTPSTCMTLSSQGYSVGSSSTKIKIFYGPHTWFRERTQQIEEPEYFLNLVEERDESRRHFIVRQEGRKNAPPVDDEVWVGLEHVLAESHDYASLNEHTITNFSHLVHALSPESLYLQNPPASVEEQLKRAFSETSVDRYQYPPITTEVLREFRDRFAEHLVGQLGVRDEVLAALYPLTKDDRTKPVVLMFYGPSGVGKTQTAHFLNGLLGGVLMRKQFSMFHSEKFASYMFGGTHSEPSFAHDLLDRDSGVILIDEFDKAAPVFHSAFYQIFDDGIFEDKNYSARLGPSVIICTSNYGTEDEINKALGDALASRFDALVRFDPLSPGEMLVVIDRIVDSKIDKLTADEEAVLDLGKVRSDLHRLASDPSNIRRIKKTVDEYFGLLLVEALLEGAES